MTEKKEIQKKKAEAERELVGELMGQGLRRRFHVPHIAELTEALIEEWAKPGTPPLKGLAKAVQEEYKACKKGSMQRAKLLDCHIRLLEITTKMGAGGAGNPEDLNDNDLMQAARDVLSDMLPGDERAKEDGALEPDAGGRATPPQGDA